MSVTSWALLIALLIFGLAANSTLAAEHPEGSHRTMIPQQLPPPIPPAPMPEFPTGRVAMFMLLTYLFASQAKRKRCHRRCHTRVCSVRIYLPQKSMPYLFTRYFPLDLKATFKNASFYLLPDYY
ncbi:hypothetical protein Ciccas_004591 [Cichlidogyrus casuarinus]|uniref:Uncharacterized protein n=1 Tax=Cichlidogyrus casuarinus TaxID=1844966 RepID=A0ABD2QB15_9PLAT